MHDFIDNYVFVYDRGIVTADIALDQTCTFAGSLSIDSATEGTINQAWFDAKGYSKVTVLYE